MSEREPPDIGSQLRVLRVQRGVSMRKSGLEGQALEPFVVTLKSGADSGRQAKVHDGHELVYCLDGVVEYEIDGQLYRLSVGESMLFEARLPHCWRNPDSAPAVFLLLFQASTRGESVEQHLHP